MCRATPDVTTVLPASLQAPALARSLLTGAVCRRHRPAMVDASSLVVTELVANAVLHGHPPITLRIRCGGVTGVEFRVGDGSSTPPELMVQPAKALGGRGVQLVDMLSAAWGVLPTMGGKVVWARVR